MKRTMLFAFAFVASCIAMLGCLVAFNNTTPILRQGETLTTECAQGCALSGWTASEDKTSFAFRFRIPEGSEPLSLAIPNVTSFSLSLNGEPLYRYDDSEPSARLKLIELPKVGGDAEIAILFDSPQNSVRAQLGTTERMKTLDALGVLMFAFCLGCQALMFLYCLSLWMQKPDETILLFMMALILIVVARDVTQPFALLPQSAPTLLKPGLNMALAFGMTLLSAWYVFPRVFSERKLVLPLSILALAAALAVSYLVRGKAETLVFISLHTALHVLCAAIILRGCANRVPCSWPMLLGLGFAIASFAFYTEVDRGTIPAGTLAVQGYVIQLYNLPFLFACVMALNSRFVGYYRDLKRINAELDALVDEKVEALRLQESQKHQLMTNVFHDLRTPLFIAKGCVEQIREGRDELKALATLDERIDFMSQLTQDLFMIAKLETDDLFLVEDAVDLSALCERQADACEVQAQEKGIVLSSRILPGCMVWGDEHRINQAVQNLLANAVAHSPERGTIEFSVRKGGENVLVEVSDAGEGVPEDEATRIFDRYYRANPGNSNDSSGLGLAIVSEIMKAHRGSTSVESRAGCGSTFTLSFPSLPDQ